MSTVGADGHFSLFSDILYTKPNYYKYHACPLPLLCGNESDVLDVPCRVTNECNRLCFTLFWFIRWFHWCWRRRQLSRSNLRERTSPLYIQLLLQPRNQQWPVRVYRPVAMPSPSPVRSPHNNRPGFGSQQCPRGSTTTSRLTNEPCSSSVWQCSLPEPYGASHSSPHHNDSTTSSDAATES